MASTAREKTSLRPSARAGRAASAGAARGPPSALQPLEQRGHREVLRVQQVALARAAALEGEQQARRRVARVDERVAARGDRGILRSRKRRTSPVELSRRSPGPSRSVGLTMTTSKSGGSLAASASCSP
jgi:hypothetical protein